MKIASNRISNAMRLTSIRKTTVGKLLAVGTAMVLMLALLTASALAASNTFTDTFDTALGSHLEDPDSAFTVTAGEIHLITNTGGGDDRSYVRTTATSYDTGNWTYTITFDIGATGSDGEIVFIGVGSGEGAGTFNEPGNSAMFRIHNQAKAGGQVDMAVSDATGGFPGDPFIATKIGDLSSDGRFKARLEKDGGDLYFSILDMTDVTLMSGTMPVPSVISDPNARLFFGSAWPATTYDDMIVEFTDPEPPLPTTKDQCKKGGWKDFGVFKNQGDCVSFVASEGKNQPDGGGD